MMKLRSILLIGKREKAGVLIFALLYSMILLALAVEVLRSVVPRYQVTVQTAGWQEARLAAEAGVEKAMVDVNKALGDYLTYDWAGANWYQVSGTGTALASGTCLERAASGTVDSDIATGSMLQGCKSPIFLDNVDISPTTGLPARADVQLKAFYPNSNTTSSNIWFRIRSMGTSQVSGPPRAPLDRMDADLRRISLRTIRPTLLANDFGRATHWLSKA